MCIVQVQYLYCSIHSKIHIHVTAHNILETAIAVCQINNAHFKDGLYVGWLSCIFMRQIFLLFFKKEKHTKESEHAEKYVKVKVTQTRKFKLPLVSCSFYCSTIFPITFYEEKNTSGAYSTFCNLLYVDIWK